MISKDNSYPTKRLSVTFRVALSKRLRNIPAAWSRSYLNGNDDFSVQIRRDHFSYFAQSRKITVSAFDLYGANVTDHHALARPAASLDLTGPQNFTFTVGPADGLPRSPDQESFLIVRYSL
jgi:hypothetical protein